MNTLSRPVLKLNKNFQVIEECTLQKAISDLAAGAVRGLFINNGNFELHDWDKWITLPIEDNDDFISCAKGKKVKALRVVVCCEFGKVIVKPPKLTLKNLRERDGDRCIYTGKKLKPSEMSMEHVIPESQGGLYIWENIALADRDINSKRGNAPLEKVGLSLRYKPFAPRGKKPEERITNKHNYAEWNYFIKTH